MSAGSLLLRCWGATPQTESLLRDLRKFAAGHLPETQSIAAHAALESDALYAYLNAGDFTGVKAKAPQLAGAAHELPALRNLRIEAVPVELVFDTPGASHEEDAPFHYIVETDVVPEHEADLVAWYDTEHMPGLAACPGSVHARRFRNLDGSPRYHSCYDLARTEAFGSEPWLAVRHSKWSDRVRPHFRNSRRTMFRRLFDLAL